MLLGDSSNRGKSRLLCYCSQNRWTRKNEKRGELKREYLHCIYQLHIKKRPKQSKNCFNLNLWQISFRKLWSCKRNWHFTLIEIGKETQCRIQKNYIRCFIHWSCLLKLDTYLESILYTIDILQMLTVLFRTLQWYSEKSIYTVNKGKF